MILKRKYCTRLDLPYRTMQIIIANNIFLYSLSIHICILFHSFVTATG